jgi:hypothetical protein
MDIHQPTRLLPSNDLKNEVNLGVFAHFYPLYSTGRIYRRVIGKVKGIFSFFLNLSAKFYDGQRGYGSQGADVDGQ